MPRYTDLTIERYRRHGPWGFVSYKREIDAPEPAVVDAMLHVADGRLDRDAFAEWIRSVVVPWSE